MNTTALTTTTLTASTLSAASLLDNWEEPKETTAATSQASRNSNRDNTKLFRSRPVQAKIYVARRREEYESVEVESPLKDA